MLRSEGIPPNRARRFGSSIGIPLAAFGLGVVCTIFCSRASERYQPNQETVQLAWPREHRKPQAFQNIDPLLKGTVSERMWACCRQAASITFSDSQGVE